MDIEMTTSGASVSRSLIPEEKLSVFFGEIRRRLQKNGSHENPDASIIGWSTPTLGEVNPNVERSLGKKYLSCEDKGFRAAKIAGLYAFWIAKLKPIFSPFNKFRALNEYAALHVGIAYVNERISIAITLNRDEMLDMCETLRYHTSSPHTMMHLFMLLIERESLKKRLSEAEEKLKKHGIT